MKVKVLIGTLSFIGGFATGYFIKHLLDKKAFEEMQDNFDYAMSALNDINEQLDAENEFQQEAETLIHGYEGVETEDGYFQSDDPNDFVPEGFYNEQGPEEIDEDETLDIGPEEDGEEPYIIDADMYSEHQEFTKCICEYYASNGILCDGENGAIYEDLSPIGGLNMIRAMEEGKEEVIYIRNEPEMADFEITILRKKRYETKWR